MLQGTPQFTGGDPGRALAGLRQALHADSRQNQMSPVDIVRMARNSYSDRSQAKKWNGVFLNKAIRANWFWFPDNHLCKSTIFIRKRKYNGHLQSGPGDSSRPARRRPADEAHDSTSEELNSDLQKNSIVISSQSKT